jgi:hypothetical protein
MATADSTVILLIQNSMFGYRPQASFGENHAGDAVDQLILN